jgi:5'-deoxynucleotidase YfbR-like HD superfamily hydrolase
MSDPTLYAGDTILTYSGHYLNVFDPDPDHICIEDIAHGLSRIPRFAGQTESFLSVAQHSFNVSIYLADEFALEGLLHDASEAYLMDIPKPIKKHLPDYIKLEDQLMKAIAKKFDFPYPKSPEVKKADRNQLEFEHLNLRVNNNSNLIFPDFEQAETLFLWRYKELIRKEATNA